jgi:Polyketide cyclase / dehydrase and lipid transport
MRSATVTAVLPAPREKVFAYLSDIENLPEWATEFARGLRREDGAYKVVNNLGEFHFEIRADERTGVIDMLAGPSPDELALFPTRAVELPDGTTAYTFTMFQGPDMPDDLFDSQYASLQREFDNIRAVFS